jgi:hypothetical protein
MLFCGTTLPSSENAARNEYRYLSEKKASNRSSTVKEKYSQKIKKWWFWQRLIPSAGVAPARGVFCPAVDLAGPCITHMAPADKGK